MGLLNFITYKPIQNKKSPTATCTQPRIVSLVAQIESACYAVSTAVAPFDDRDGSRKIVKNPSGYGASIRGSISSTLKPPARCLKWVKSGQALCTVLTDPALTG